MPASSDVINMAAQIRQPPRVDLVLPTQLPTRSMLPTSIYSYVSHPKQNHARRYIVITYKVKNMSHIATAIINLKSKIVTKD